MRHHIERNDNQANYVFLIVTDGSQRKQNNFTKVWVKKNCKFLIVHLPKLSFKKEWNKDCFQITLKK